MPTERNRFNNFYPQHEGLRKTIILILFWYLIIPFYIMSTAVSPDVTYFTNIESKLSDERKSRRTMLFHLLLRMYQACALNVDASDDITTNPLAARYDMIWIFYMTYKMCRPWRHLPFYQDLSQNEKDAADAEALVWTDLVYKSLKNPPTNLFSKLWTDIRTAIQQFRDNENDEQETVALLFDALRRYSTPYIRWIDTVLRANLDDVPDIEFINPQSNVDNEPYIRGLWTNNGVNRAESNPRGGQAVQHHMSANTLHPLLTSCVQDHTCCSILGTLFYGDVTTAVVRKLSRYAIPVIVTFLPASGPGIPSYWFRDLLFAQLPSLNSNHLDDDAVERASHFVGNLQSEGFFANFSGLDRSFPSGTHTGGGANAATQPNTTGWRDQLPHTTSTANEGDTSQPTQPLPTNPQPNTTPPANPVPSDDTNLEQGGNTYLKLKVRVWANQQRSKTLVNRSSHDHMLRFSTNEQKPISVLRRNIRFSDYRVTDGQSNVDPEYLVTLSRFGALPIFNPIV